MANELHARLLQQLTENNFHLSKPIIKKLLAYLLLLDKWNQIHNLTSIRNPIDMISKHIIDSLTITPYLQGPRIIDVGTGAGLPGIPLALIHPHYQFVLLDSNGKKTRFLIHILPILAITNVEVLSIRVENYTPNFCFNTILSRAFSQLNNFLLKTQHLSCEKGIFLAMKGKYPTEELTDLDVNFKLIAVKPLQIENLKEKRHVVILRDIKNDSIRS